MFRPKQRVRSAFCSSSVRIWPSSFCACQPPGVVKERRRVNPGRWEASKVRRCVYLLNDLALLGGEVLQFGVDALALALVFGELLVHRLGLLVLRLQRRLQRRDPLLPLQLLRSADG